MEESVLLPAIRKWVQLIRSCDIDWKSGIYPAEMAVFLGYCEAAGVQSIVESGRGPDAYSTRILGIYSDKMNVPVTSVDFSPIDKHYYADALKLFTRLRCVNGDSFAEVPRALQSLPQPSALLIDGPKLFTANKLSFASALAYRPTVIAHHNSIQGAPWWDEFAAFYEHAHHYEDLQLDKHDWWQAFRTWEKEHVGGYEVEDVRHGLPGRNLALSSLALGSLPSKPTLARIPSLKQRLRVGWLLLRWRMKGYLSRSLTASSR